jgi:hypothetical protein
MAEIFRVGKENTAARCDHRARILGSVEYQVSGVARSRFGC